MEDLIKALQIFSKYSKTKYPTDCEHGILYICCVDPNDVTEEDIETLDALGFHLDSETEGFASFKFGSC